MTSVHATAHPSPPGPPGSEIYRLTLPNTSGAAKVSRDFVASLLGVSRCGGLAGLVDDARLLVTEVVANAHRHTATALIQVHVAVRDERVTVSVADDAPWDLPRCPGQRDGSFQPEGGRGLLLVERVADAWGTRVLGGGVPYRKAVWFTLGRGGALRRAGNAERGGGPVGPPPRSTGYGSYYWMTVMRSAAGGASGAAAVEWATR